MEPRKFDISVIITAHHEGRLAHRTLKSLFRAKEYAANNGLIVEIIVVLDKPDVQTVNYFDKYDTDVIKKVNVEFGDLGLSRNYGIELCSGTYVALLDADDLFGRDWLYKAHLYMRTSGSELILHPEYSVFFEGKNHVWKHIDSTSHDYDPLQMLVYNYWTSLCFAKREIFIKFPYEITTKASGYGFEDWHFNCETLAGGVEHRVVPGTVMLIRAKRSGSLLANTVAQSRMLRKTTYFEYDKVIKLTDRIDDNYIVKADNNIANALLEIKKYVSKLTDPLFVKYPKLYPFLIGKSWQLQAVASNLAGNKVVPEWLIDEWKSLNNIEPQTFPDKSTLSSLVQYKIPTSPITKYYKKLFTTIGSKVTHVVVVPWLKRAGGDLVALNYIKYLCDCGFGESLVVLSTLKGESPWCSRLPQEVCFIEFGNICSDLKEDERIALLAKLLIQWSPATLHNINSELLYKVLVRHGNAISCSTNVYTSVFCFDYTDEGKKSGWHLTYLPDCYDCLSGIFSDNYKVLDEIDEIFSFGKDKMRVHYQPIPIQSSVKKKRGVYEQLNVLWAGRIDRQKRPDILIDIAKNTLKLPIHYHVYGHSLLSSDIYSDILKNLSNVTMYGAFDGIGSLPLDYYDVLLFTSQYEGIPTTVIEAMLSGVPVIASSVGGLPEIIRNGVTGILIEPFDDVSLYVSALNNILESKYDLNLLADNGFQSVSAQHSWESFRNKISNVKGYLPK